MSCECGLSVCAVCSEKDIAQERAAVEEEVFALLETNAAEYERTGDLGYKVVRHQLRLLKMGAHRKPTQTCDPIENAGIPCHSCGASPSQRCSETCASRVNVVPLSRPNEAPPKETP